MMLKVAIGIPTRGADLWYKTMLYAMKEFARADMEVIVVFSESNVSARNAQDRLFKGIAYHDNNFDYALFLDGDVCVPEDTLDRLIARGKDIMVAPVWHYDHINHDIHLGVHYTASFERIYAPREGIERIFGASFSCVLVSKKVLNAFRLMDESAVKWSPLLPLEHNRDANDNIFFRKCFRLGFETWVDWDIKTASHFRRVELCTTTVERISVLHEREVEKNRSMRETQQAAPAASS